MPSSTGYNLEYFVKDHLGNNRIVFNEYNEVVQDISYYPFGNVIPELTFENFGNSPENNKLFSGMEQLNFFDLEWYDYGTRIYNPLLARWSSRDPLAEKFYSSSPYVFCQNNPLIYIDPNGKYSGRLTDWFVNFETGELFYNSTYRQEDVDKIPGSGWNWFAANGAFGEDDLEIITKNRDLINGGAMFKNGYYELEASFSPENAEKFMNKMGYQLRPLEMLTESWNYNRSFVIIPNSASSVSCKERRVNEVWLKMNYVKNYSIAKLNYSKLLLDEDLNSSGYYSQQFQSFSYNQDKVQSVLKKYLGPILDPNSLPTYNSVEVYKNWQNYPVDGRLNVWR